MADRKIVRFLVTVELEVEATSEEAARRAVMRGLDNGIGDIGEIESAEIAEVDGPGLRRARRES